MPDKVELVPDEKKQVNIEEAFNDLFKGASSASGDEELLRIVSDFSLQLSSSQIRALIWLKTKAITLQSLGRKTEAQMLVTVIEDWVKYKKNNFSDVFMMRAVESISLRKFIGNNSFKVDVMK